LKQEKKQTVWFDAEVKFDKLQPWQKQILGSGLKKGDKVAVSFGRRTGKSQMTIMQMAGMGSMGGTAVFGSPWEEWEDVFVWPWNPKKSIESGKRIWGRVKVRYNSIVWEANGRQKQYATKKEVFQRKLKGID
jgi:hypothetical protein